MLEGNDRSGPWTTCAGRQWISNEEILNENHPSVTGNQSTNTATDNFKSHEKYGDGEDHIRMPAFVSSAPPSGLS
jgi:hypothetical protein